MHNILFSKNIYTLLLLFVSSTYSLKAAEVPRYWDIPHAKVTEKGDILYSPKPFNFNTGKSPRYIDYEQGSDLASGTKPSEAWQHHPWDPDATHNPKATQGTHTYIFKRGVTYRGRLIANESGTADEPLQLTSDPKWGQGEAVFSGTENVTSWKKGSVHPNIPEGDKVWRASVQMLVRTLWAIDKKTGEIHRIPLARTPNWKRGPIDDIKKEWWSFHFTKGKHYGQRVTVEGVEKLLGQDEEHLTQSADYYEGAYVLPEYGWVMGMPYHTKIVKYFPDRKAIAFGGEWSAKAGRTIIHNDMRYSLEDKPHYLDDGLGGEFWFDKTSDDAGTIYLRTPQDRPIEDFIIEAGKTLDIITNAPDTVISHLDISGLTFRYQNMFWSLEASDFDPTANTYPTCIKLAIESDVHIHNNIFEHVTNGISLTSKAIKGDVSITDNDLSWVDGEVIKLYHEATWAASTQGKELGKTSILRNHIHDTGYRPCRYGQGHAINTHNVPIIEVAGNFVERVCGSGIFIYGGKEQKIDADVPFARTLIHHNKVVDPLLNSNDWGGIETWQGGPAYVYNNLSVNPGGYKRWSQMTGGDTRFGHAYYLDGAFKNYYFNNIAWGQESDPKNPKGNCAAFQEIHGYQNTFLNNSAYRFANASRRQGPEAGRNKYLGNAFQDIGDFVFRHAQPAKENLDPNAADVGIIGSEFDHSSVVYHNNVFEDLKNKFGTFESHGKVYETFKDFAAAVKSQSVIGNIGTVRSKSLFKDPEHMDMRPTTELKGLGVRAFIPWSLSGVVGEWNFQHAGGNPSKILDEHWYMTQKFLSRTDYLKETMFHLKGVGIEENNYSQDPTEDWGNGALTLSGKAGQFCTLAASECTENLPENDNSLYEKNNIPWLDVIQVPTSVEPGGDRYTMIVKPKKVPGLNFFHMDVHAMGKNSTYLGFNAWGGGDKPANANAPIKLTFRVNPKEGLYDAQLIFLAGDAKGKDNPKLRATWLIPVQSAHEAENNPKLNRLKSPQMYENDFLVELWFRPDTDAKAGLLLSKKSKKGYELRLNDRGQVEFEVLADKSYTVVSEQRLTDGKWHHLIAECDRQGEILQLYIDGQKTKNAKGPKALDISNNADLIVGGAIDQPGFKGALGFLRLSQGTLADAKTTIEELYAWEFDGPFLRDRLGHLPTGPRDAGAIEGL